MSGIAVKKPIKVSLTNFGKQVSFDTFKWLGQALPCHVVERNGAIVTVAFDVQPPKGVTIPQTQCPILESQYVKLPIKVGDRGVTIPIMANIAPLTGLGGEAAPYTNIPFNLSSLIFVPVGNLGWSNPDGTATIVTSQNEQSVVTVGDSGITMTKGSSSISITSSGIEINGTSVKIKGKEFLTHTHTGVQTGGGNSGGVTP